MGWTANCRNWSSTWEQRCRTLKQNCKMMWGFRSIMLPRESLFDTKTIHAACFLATSSFGTFLSSPSLRLFSDITAECQAKVFNFLTSSPIFGLPFGFQLFSLFCLVGWVGHEDGGRKSRIGPGSAGFAPRPDQRRGATSQWVNCFTHPYRNFKMLFEKKS